jgi:hypothetical protein
MARADQAELPYFFDPAAQTDETDEMIAVADRLDITHRVAGFLPTTHRELNETMTLLDYIGKPSGTAAHLNEILIHQKKSVSEDPAAAVRSITNEYAGYIAKARMDKTQLGLFGDEIRLQRTTPSRTVNLEALHSGLGQFARFVDLRAFAAKIGGAALPANPLRAAQSGKNTSRDRYTVTIPDPEMRDRILAVVGKTPQKKAAAITAAAVVDQTNRIAFWTARLQESRRHMAARPIAYEALLKLGIRPE